MGAQHVGNSVLVGRLGSGSSLCTKGFSDLQGLEAELLTACDSSPKWAEQQVTQWQGWSPVSGLGLAVWIH